jgi:hypothetical protein
VGRLKLQMPLTEPIHLSFAGWYIKSIYFIFDMSKNDGHHMFVKNLDLRGMLDVLHWKQYLYTKTVGDKDVYNQRRDI